VASTKQDRDTPITLQAQTQIHASTTARLKRPLMIDPDVDTDIRDFMKEARRVYRQHNPAGRKRVGRHSLQEPIEEAFRKVHKSLSPRERLFVKEWVSQIQRLFQDAGEVAPHDNTIRMVIRPLFDRLPPVQRPPLPRRSKAQK
jgi:hypothetical protein